LGTYCVKHVFPVILLITYRWWNSFSAFADCIKLGAITPV
jgi:hypothetical protein